MRSCFNNLKINDIIIINEDSYIVNRVLYTKDKTVWCINMAESKSGAKYSLYNCVNINKIIKHK